MRLYQNILNGLRYKHWTCLETIAYFAKGVARELKIAPSFFLKYHSKITLSTFKKKWLRKNGSESYFDFNGCKLPDISASDEKMNVMLGVFEDVFLFPCYHNDNYDKDRVILMDSMMTEGPYGYTDGNFDVTVKKGDVVIDAGAWVGDFSAYAVSKGATAYAFEPTKETCLLLDKTCLLDSVKWGGVNLPYQKRIGRDGV
jgi:hypothetical protein